MGKFKKQVATPLITILVAGFLGIGNYAVNLNPDQPTPAAAAFSAQSAIVPPSQTHPTTAQPAESQPAATLSGGIPPTASAGDYVPESTPRQPESSAVRTPQQDTGTCVSVYDGDTITVRLANSPQKLTKVRLIGIDTPELRVGEFGEATKNFTKSLLLGQEVRLVYDAERYDKYGRTLAYVYLKDGTFVNARLLEKGYARVMTIPPNTAHAAEFNKLQNRARAKQVGIWAQPPPKATWWGEKVTKE